VRDNYQYVDPDYAYTDPKTGLLRKKENIDNNQLLLVFESLKCSVRLEELVKTPIAIKGSTSLFDIHKYIFQDVYERAGKKRTVEISKGGRQFFPISHFDTALSYIDKFVTEYRNIDKNDKKKNCST
jgi:cell filamentation protein